MLTILLALIAVAAETDAITGTFKQENGTLGVYFQWNAWPVGKPYRIERSSNLVDWETVATSYGDSGRTMVVFDLAKTEYYRIVAI